MGEEGYFTRDKAADKKGEEQFFAQGEKPEVSLSSDKPNIAPGLRMAG